MDYAIAEDAIRKIWTQIAAEQETLKVLPSPLGFLLSEYPICR